MSLLIVLEGIDGSGKTTLAKGLESYYSNKGKKVFRTFEPTKSLLGNTIRNNDIGDNRAETLLFVADRICHTKEMKEKMDEGYVVICDRYFSSTLAYQSATTTDSKYPDEFIRKLNSEFFDVPDITFLVDIDPEIGSKRVNTRGEELSRFEKLTFQKAVRSNYLKIAEEMKFTILDGSKTPEEVLSDAIEQLKKLEA